MRYKDYTGPSGRILKPLAGPIEDYEDKLRGIFGRFEEIMITYLFGSQAKGIASHESSDVDIALVAPDIRLKVYKNVWLAIREVLSTERFDLVVLDDKPVSFRFEVIKEGRSIYMVDENFLNAFELRTIKCYLDTKPLRSYYGRALEEQLNGL